MSWNLLYFSVTKTNMLFMGKEQNVCVKGHAAG